MAVVKIRAGDGVSLWTWTMARISGLETNAQQKTFAPYSTISTVVIDNTDHRHTSVKMCDAE